MLWSALSCGVPANPPLVGPPPAVGPRDTAAPSAPAAHTGEALPSGPPPRRVGACDIDTSGAATLVPRVVYALSSFDTAPFDGLIGNVFTDAATLDPYLSARGLPPATVDFAAETAAVVAYNTNGSCFTEVMEIAAWDVGGAPHVVVLITDDSFGCESQCDAEGTAAAVVAVPIGASPPTACGSVGGGCGLPPAR